MALFSVSRYMGEDDPEGINEKGSSASKILEKIRTEAKKRREARESGKQPLETGKSRRPDIQTDKAEELVRNGDSKDTSTDQCKKKSKKRKKKIEEKDSDEEVRSKKLKKQRKLNKDEIKKKMEKEDIDQEVETTRRKETKKPEEQPNEEMDTLNEEMDPKLEKSNETDLPADNVEEDDIETEDVGRFPVLGDFKQKTVQKEAADHIWTFVFRRNGVVYGRLCQVSRVLPDWLSSPSIITADLRSTTRPVGEMAGLDSHLVLQLQENQISHFFPVQLQVIPALLDTLACGLTVGKAGYRPSDICVSAPTGSGKTLAFVLPIIQALKGRVHRRVCAMAVLPVKDLALQVYNVFQAYCKGTDLKVGLLTGQKPFAMEQHTLVKRSLRGYQSLVDIVVATPGRLVDHICRTAGFDLTGLRFLVIDEADKMMELIKQDWLVRVENAVYQDPLTRARPGILTPNRCLKPQIPLQKLLFSATLSQNPEKLQQLNLFQPKLFTSVVKLKHSNRLPEHGENANQSVIPAEPKGEFVGKYTTPQGLSEYFVECTPATKPLLVLHYLHNLMFSSVLCFVNSKESTHRLYHVMKKVGGKEVREFSSGLPGRRRRRMLEEFSNGKVDIIICTDAMARGMDIDNVKLVMSYDPPSNIKTYIHRVGRTARAGKVGTAITLLQKKEFYHFKKMTREAGKTGILERKVSEKSLEPLVPGFKEALEQVPEVLKTEKLKRKSKG